MNLSKENFLVSITLFLNLGCGAAGCKCTTSFVSVDSSGDELWPPAQRLLPPAAAGPHRRVPAHEDAQEDPGTPVICLLRDL